MQWPQSNALLHSDLTMGNHPLTSAQKQARRMSELDAIAQAAAWPTWTRYATAVKRGVVSIAANPAASRENGKRGGRPRKEQRDD